MQQESEQRKQKNLEKVQERQTQNRQETLWTRRNQGCQEDHNLHLDLPEKMEDIAVEHKDVDLLAGLVDGGSDGAQHLLEHCMAAEPSQLQEVLQLEKDTELPQQQDVVADEQGTGVELGKPGSARQRQKIHLYQSQEKET